MAYSNDSILLRNPIAGVRFEDDPEAWERMHRARIAEDARISEQRLSNEVRRRKGFEMHGHEVTLRVLFLPEIDKEQRRKAIQWITEYIQQLEITGAPVKTNSHMIQNKTMESRYGIPYEDWEDYEERD